MKRLLFVLVFLFVSISSLLFSQGFIYDREYYINPDVETRAEVNREILDNVQDGSYTNQNTNVVRNDNRKKEKELKKNLIFFELGPKVGVTFGMTYVRDFKSVRAGIVLEMPFYSFFGIQLNFTYSLYSVIFAGVNQTQPDTYNAISDAVGGQSTYVHYLDVNPFFKFYLGPIWLGIGPAFNMALNGVGKQYAFDGNEGFDTFQIVEQETKTTFGIYFSLGGVIKVTDLVYILPEAHATVYPIKKTPFSPDTTFRFLSTEWATFGFNIALAFKVG